MAQGKTHMYTYYVLVPEYKRSRCAVAKDLGWSEGDFAHLHLLTVSF